MATSEKEQSKPAFTTEIKKEIENIITNSSKLFNWSKVLICISGETKIPNEIPLYDLLTGDNISQDIYHRFLTKLGDAGNIALQILQEYFLKKPQNPPKTIEAIAVQFTHLDPDPLQFQQLQVAPLIDDKNEQPDQTNNASAIENALNEILNGSFLPYQYLQRQQKEEVLSQLNWNQIPDNFRENWVQTVAQQDIKALYLNEANWLNHHHFSTLTPLFKELEILDVNSTLISEAILTKILSQARPRLETLSIVNCEYIWNLPELRTYCPKLKSLNISQSNLIEITDIPASIETLIASNCKNLTTFIGQNSQLKTLILSNNERLTVVKNLPPTLSSLSLSNCKNLTDLDFPIYTPLFSQIPRPYLNELKKVDLSHNSKLRVTGALPETLETFNVSHTKIRIQPLFLSKPSTQFITTEVPGHIIQELALKWPDIGIPIMIPIKLKENPLKFDMAANNNISNENSEPWFKELPDGRLLSSGPNQKTLIWDPRKPDCTEPVGVINNKITSKRHITLLSDGKIALANKKGVTIKNVEEDKPITISGNIQFVFGLPGMRLIISSEDTKTIWNIKKNRIPIKTNIQIDSSLNDIYELPDKRLVCVSTSKVEIINFSGKPVKEIEIPSGFQFTKLQDGKFLLNNGSTFRIFNTESLDSYTEFRFDRSNNKETIMQLRNGQILILDENSLNLSYFGFSSISPTPSNSRTSSTSMESPTHSFYELQDGRFASIQENSILIWECDYAKDSNINIHETNLYNFNYLLKYELLKTEHIPLLLDQNETELNVCNTPINIEQLTAIFMHCKTLKVLYCENCPNLPNEFSQFRNVIPAGFEAKFTNPNVLPSAPPYPDNNMFNADNV